MASNTEPTPARQERSERTKVPRGVIFLGLMLYMGGLISAATGLVLSADALNGLPRWVPLTGSIVLMVLATGLFRRRRWAYLSMLSFILVSAFYLLRGTAERGENTIVGLTILAIIAAYLLWPKVRSVYLAP
jgi:uncharacterized membrane protein